MSKLLNNTSNLQEVLETINSLPNEPTNPEISVDAEGLITATAGTKSSTYQMAFQPAKTITPSVTSQIAVSSGYYTGGNITVAGDSNLAAENIKSGISIFGIEGTLEEGSGSSEVVEYSENEDAIITKEISGIYVNDRVKSIGNHAFASCSSLTAVSFPACTRIYSAAFTNCSSLTTVSFPVCTSISSHAFAGCSSLTTVSFPVCTSISTYVFYDCRKLTSVSFPVCTSIYGNAFTNCYSLASVFFPVCTRISGYAFGNCYSLTSVSFPACTSIGGSTAFQKCRALSSLTLGASTVCTLSNSNVFSSTPFTGYSSYFSGIPYIYVPASLIDAYKSATNWVYFSSYFSAIESLDISLFAFQINGVEYYMMKNSPTWEEWIASSHNTGGFYINELTNTISLDSYTSVRLIDNTMVDKDDLIMEGYNYILVVSNTAEPE